MVVPEKILNMEVDANKEFNQLNARIALKTQPSISKGKAKATGDPPGPKLSRPKAPAKGKELKKAEGKPKPAAKSARAASKAVAPKATRDRPPVRRERVKRDREEEMEVDLWFECEGREGTYLEPGPLRKRARQEGPTGPFAWPAGIYETASTSAVRVRYRSRHHEESNADWDQSE